jgi:hypothetical protein
VCNLIQIPNDSERQMFIMHPTLSQACMSVLIGTGENHKVSSGELAEWSNAAVLKTVEE